MQMQPIVATVNVPWSDVENLAEEFIAKKFSVVEVRVTPIDGDARHEAVQ